MENWARDYSTNNDNIKSIITYKFKEKIQGDKKLEDKRKLRYYKEVINPSPKYLKCPSILTSVHNKVNIVKRELDNS